jgi:hypothetical protein
MRCDDCGRVVPTHETREGPYETWDGRLVCLYCITLVEDQVQRFWPLLQGTEPEPHPLSLEQLLHRLGIQP